MEENSLAEIGARYAEEARQLGEMIGACRERRQQALMRGQSAEALRQERLIELHTRQQGDVLQLSHWLRHYYDHEKTEEAEYAEYRSDAACG
jgi:hypothetical protein